MNNKKLDPGRVWKQFEDYLVPQLRLSVIDRAVYSHLLRHSRLEGKQRVRFSLVWLANGARLCIGTTRQSLNRLFDHGALRLIECGKTGHVVQVRLPEEIRGVRRQSRGSNADSPRGGPRNDGLPAKRDAAGCRPRARAWPMLLLYAAGSSAKPVPRPRCATRKAGAQFVPQPRFLLCGLQLEEEGALC